MNKTLTFWLKLLTGASFFVFLVWAIRKPDYEPIGGALGSLAVFLALFVVERKKPKPPTMRQRGGDDSTNYQSGGDMTIHPPK